MSLLRRIKLIFSAKASKALDRAEDPRETLDYSYEKQLQLLANVRRGVADVATSRKRLEIQLDQLRSSADRLQLQAKQAVDNGRDDLAREALTRRASVNAQVVDLTRQYDSLQGEEEKIVAAQQRLQAQVDAFRTKKETLKATYTAAEAQTKISEAVAGISGEFDDIGLAMQRAEDKTLQMQARAGAVDELLASGALDDASMTPTDRIQRELDSVTSDSSIDAELAALKAGDTPALEAALASPTVKKTRSRAKTL